MRAPAFLTLLFLLLAFARPGQAASQDDLLPVEQAFPLQATVSAPGTISLRWDIAPGYYLYRHRIQARAGEGVTLGELDLPPGEATHDEFLGDVEIFHDTVQASLPYSLADTGLRRLELTVTAQGCHENEPRICYPPHPTRLSLELPPAAAAASAPALDLAGASGLSGLQGLSGLAGSTDGGKPLPADQAFQFDVIADGPGRLLARWVVAPGYYLYRDRSSLRLAEGSGVELGQLEWPPAAAYNDDNFGDVQVYFEDVELPASLRRERATAQDITVVAEYQGCQDGGLCYPILTREVALTLPATDAEGLAALNAAFVPPPAGGSDAPARSLPPQVGILALFGALLLAIAGGVVLNLMPCVLPVLSLKVLGLAQSGTSRAAARRHALWYTAGVLASFAAVGLLVLALRSAGQALGWGFQLQQPVFVGVLVYVLLAVGLSLSGVFQLGAGLAGVGQGLAGRTGPAGDFFTGVLAVVVASPCTAPFMGTALAFAFAASPWMALAIFLCLGLGLALPFLLVGFVPALAARLPRPGAWMETFKQLLAFPMYLTAVWLVWVLGKQRGVDAVAWILAGAVVLALGLWGLERSRRGGLAPRLAVAAVLALSLVSVVQVGRIAPAGTQVEADAPWQPWTAGRLAELRAGGRTVFVEMTADWCVTCKANERAVLLTDRFDALLKDHDAVWLRGDWTNVDPAITAFLQEHQAVGVPLYVVYPANGTPQALPTVLTHGIVAEAFGQPAAP